MKGKPPAAATKAYDAVKAFDAYEDVPNKEPVNEVDVVLPLTLKEPVTV